MFDDAQLRVETRRTYDRLLPRVEAVFAAAVATPEWETFRRRLDAHFPQLFRLLVMLYGGRYDFYHHLEQILLLAAQSWLDRPADLKALAAEREQAPDWFQAEQMLGGVCYVVLYAGSLDGLRAKIPYFQ